MLIPNTLQVYAVIAVIAVALGVGGYFYIDSLQTKVETLETNLRAAETALRANESAIQLQDQTLKDVQVELLALADADAKTDRDVANLRRRVNDALRVANDPATARPEAEAAINALSADTLGRLRASMTGADDIDEHQ